MAGRALSSVTLAATAAATVAAAGGSPVFDALSSLVFLNQGVHRPADAYAFAPIECLYLEPDNVTCAQCTWGESGSCPYLSLASATPSQCNASAPTPGTDRPGGDVSAAPITGGWQACQARCCGDSLCTSGWVYVDKAPSHFLNCAPGDQCCYLKGGAAPPAPVNSSIPGITSGTVSKPVPSIIPPPLGMRSAVPLGGIGAGAIELRGDGSFHEWTVVNQSPGGAAKFGVVGDALLGLKLNGVAKSVRTHPPGGIPGIDGSITYSGAYPVSRLSLADSSIPSGVGATVYAFTRFKPGDMQASGTPAIAFTLALNNSGTSQPLDVAFALALPWGGINDCARNSKASPASFSAPNAAACAQACAGNASTCASWTHRAVSGGGAGQCTLNPDVPWSVHEAGATCGLAGQWAASETEGTLSFFSFAGGDSNPATGSITLAASGGSEVAGLKVTSSVGNSVGDVWTSFAQGSSVPASIGTHGLLSVSGSVAAGARGSVTIVLSWYFPHRDHMGEVIGNYYSTMYAGSEEAAASLADADALLSTVTDIGAYHSLFTSPSSSLPTWLADHAINSVSHVRYAIWTADGRWRQWEAPDCADVDSIHNDYQRHLPYIWFFPNAELSKMVKWASSQVLNSSSPDYGLIYEYLGSFGLGPLDVPGGEQ